MLVLKARRKACLQWLGVALGALGLCTAALIRASDAASSRSWWIGLAVLNAAIAAYGLLEARRVHSFRVELSQHGIRIGTRQPIPWTRVTAVGVEPRRGCVRVEAIDEAARRIRLWTPPVDDPLLVRTAFEQSRRGDGPPQRA